MQVILITGISGSGKSIALRVLEDDGLFCIDNLPVRFLQEVIAHLDDTATERVAVAIDSRGGRALAELPSTVSNIAEAGHDVKLLFLDARTDALIQRYSETRRRHPLSTAAPGQALPTLTESIAQERELLAQLEAMSMSIDTSDLHPNVLRAWVREAVQSSKAALTLLFESFAYKTGVPTDADIVFDVRCLPNPFYETELRPLNGRDAPVIAYLDAIDTVQNMVGDITRFVEQWLPHYILENRNYLTVAIGCTGGQHRSVYCVERLAAHFRGKEQVLVRHRGLAMRAQAHT